MAIKSYHDYVVVADEVKPGAGGLVESFSVHVFDSPAGQSESKEVVNVPGELYREVRRLEGRSLDGDADAQMNLGEMLASLLLPEGARRLFRESLKRIGDGEGLRLRLRLAEEIGHLPWEYMYIPDGGGNRTSGGFLALDPRISIARHEAREVPGDWFRAPGSRRVLVAMATPEPHARYRRLSSLPAEQKELRAALGAVAGIEPVFTPTYEDGGNEVIKGVTLEDLMTALVERTDVFHFSGHGEFDRKDAVGSIVLADENNQALTLPADRLAEVLRGRGVRLVVLGACETGRRDGRNVWSGTATTLLRAGIPSVVAMQFTINDVLAAAFSSAFYRALVAGLTVDEAVALGRLALRAQAPADARDMRDWGVPVLYLRAPGGVVFNPVSDEQAVTEAKEQNTRLVEQTVREVTVTGRMVGAAIDGLKTGTVEIQQNIEERASGLVIGGYAVNVQGGRLVVRQKADILDGTEIGLVLVDDADQRSVAEQLRELLNVNSPPAAGARTPAPSEPAGADASSAAKVCARCDTRNQPNARFCRSCGEKLG